MLFCSFKFYVRQMICQYYCMMFVRPLQPMEKSLCFSIYHIFLFHFFFKYAKGPRCHLIHVINYFEWCLSLLIFYREVWSILFLCAEILQVCYAWLLGLHVALALFLRNILIIFIMTNRCCSHYIEVYMYLNLKQSYIPCSIFFSPILRTNILKSKSLWLLNEKQKTLIPHTLGGVN